MNSFISPQESIPQKVTVPPARPGFWRCTGAAMATWIAAWATVSLLSGQLFDLLSTLSEKMGFPSHISESAMFLILWQMLIGAPTALAGAFSKKWWRGPLIASTLALILMPFVLLAMSQDDPGRPVFNGVLVLLSIVILAVASAAGAIVGHRILKPKSYAVRPE
jgi:peptidoglycan/LPS O-acetylase OafA/YrhL